MKKLIFLILFAGFMSYANTQTAYITNQNSNTVSVINLATNTVSDSINVGMNPAGVSVSSDGSKVYVTNDGTAANTVSVINTSTNTVTSTITVGNSPFGISVSPDGSKVYVGNQFSNTVSVINTATNAVTDAITVSNMPIGISVSPDGSKVYVTLAGYPGKVDVINTATNTVTATIIVINPQGVTVSPDGSKVYVTNDSTNTVTVINTATDTVMATISVGNTPEGISVSPDGSKVYVANTNSNTVSVINTASNTITATITVGNMPFGISVSPDGSKVYVANSISNTVSVINTGSNTVTDSIKVGSGPTTFGNFISTYIQPTACQASFGYDTINTYPNTINFTDYSSGYINSWLWTFGDSTSSTAQNPVHTYLNNGTYTVCLTASDIDSSGHVVCSSTYCTIIVVGNPPTTCQAYFEYYSDTTNTNIVDFYDYSSWYSSGNINSWLWTFGDSTSSTLQNPVHTYAGNGAYTVCLTASDIDSSGVLCSNTYCTTVVIGNPPTNCQAYYGYYVDTTHANVIDFYDYSGLYSSGNINSWYWTFGDSTSSTLQNPVHTYANYGQYEVCLTASDIDTNGNVICSSTYCNWVYDNSYSDSLYSIQGTIYADGTPTNAAVILFNTDHWYYNAVGYENATGGVFEFDNIKLGHYILWAIPDTTMSPVYLPTYFGDVLYWQNAYDSLYINANTYNVNIHLVPLDSASGHQKVMTGNGSISGTVKFDNNLTYEVNIFDQNWFGPTGSGGNTYSNIAGKNIPVFLKNTSGNILDWALAKADGGFTFSNLALQDYTVNAEKASLQSVSPVIPLTSTHPIVNNVNINIGMHNIVTSVKELTYDVLNSFSYYPNPVKDKLNLVFNLEKQAMIDISIINVTGQVVNRYNYSLSEGSNTLSLDMSELSSGMYFVRINANSANAANFKIVK